MTKMNDTLRNQFVTKYDVINALCFDCLHGDLDENRCYNYPCAEIEAVMRMPVKQPEVIRCRECKHYYFADNRIPQEKRYTCDLDGDRWSPDSYCSFAERKDDE